MKLLMESWRKYLLTEVSFADAKEILNSKRTMKIIKAYRYDKGQDDTIDRWDAALPRTQHRNFINYLLDQIPDDLTDNQKGSSVLWLLKLSRENPSYAASFIEGSTNRFRNVWDHLEVFFHHQRFMPQQDLMQVKSIEDLEKMAEEAKDEIHAAQEKKNYLDAEQGTEMFRDDDEWFIAALHNKGAACELGKNTDWCTAASGLNYFEDYYEPEDPLFYFRNKSNLNKYQFHYGSQQFMDWRDHRVDEESFKALHNMLKQTEAYEKYPIIKEYEFEKLSRNSQTDEEEFSKLLATMENPFEEAQKLAMRTTTASHILSWLAVSEYAKNIEVASALIDNDYLSVYDLAHLAKSPNLPIELLTRAREKYNERMRADISMGLAQPMQEHFKRFLK
jgi:hypothetical protein